MVEVSAMTTITLTLTMPDELAEQAEEAGLLSSSSLLQLIRREVRQHRVGQLFQAADRLVALDDASLTDAELSAEIATARSERRTRHAMGS